MDLKLNEVNVMTESHALFMAVVKPGQQSNSALLVNSVSFGNQIISPLKAS